MTQYPARDLVLAELALLVRTLGGAGAAAQIVVIGGIAPALLVPTELDATEAHVGTTDLDLCLSVALVDGDTAEYARIEQLLKSIGYEPTDTSFRWVRREGLEIEVEFFCPASPDRPAGELFRPKAADNPTAKHNLGGRLTALALDAGETLTADVQEYDWHGTLPGDRGEATATIRHTGALGLLMAKVKALRLRDKDKDGYDVAWLAHHWPGGAAEALATAMTTSHAWSEGLRDELVETLSVYFGAEGRGSVMYADVWAAATGTTNRERIVERRRIASGAVEALVAALTS
jgi:hypothetical protein